MGFLFIAYKVPHRTSQIHIKRNLTVDCYAKKQGVHSARGQAGTVLLQCATGDTEDSFACRRCRRNAQNTVYIRLMGEFACRVYSHFLPIPSPLNHSHSHSHSREKGSYVPSFHGNFMGPT